MTSRRALIPLVYLAMLAAVLADRLHEWATLKAMNYNGTLIGSPSFVAGELVLNGSGQYVTVADPNFDTPDSWTVEGWIKTTANNQIVCGSFFDDGTDNNWIIVMDGSGQLKAYLHGLYESTVTSLSANDGAKHHFALAVTGNAPNEHNVLYKLFLDGVLVQQSAGGQYNRASNPSTLYLGAAVGGAAPFTGTFDEFRISNINRYDANFTPPSIPLSSATPNTLALYHFDTDANVAAPAITSPTSANGYVGAAFTYQIIGTLDPTSYSASGVPTGLSIDESMGVVSGALTVPGVSVITLNATNAGGTGSATLTLTTVVPTYTAAVASAIYLSDAIQVGIYPAVGEVLPTGLSVTITPSSGGPAVTYSDIPSGGGNVSYTPAAAGTQVLTFTNNKGLPDPAPATLRVLPGLVNDGHGTPAYTGTNQLAAPNDSYIYTPQSTARRYGNTFLLDETPGFVVPASILWNPSFLGSVPVTSYEVRDIDGNMVSSGSVPFSTSEQCTITFPEITGIPGWYELKLFNAAVDSTYKATFGETCGEAFFVVMDTDAHLPTPGLYGHRPITYPATVDVVIPDGAPIAETVHAWGGVAPNPCLFRFTGTFTPTATGDYSFGFGSAPTKVTVNGNVVLDQWNMDFRGTDGYVNDHTIHLTPGVAYPMIVEQALTTGASFGFPIKLNGGDVDITSMLADEDGVSGGLTRRRYDGYSPALAGYTDEYLRAMLGCAVGPQRFAVDANTNIANYAEAIRIFLAMECNQDTARQNRYLIFSFRDYARDGRGWTTELVASQTQAILDAGLTPSQFVIEGTNEPQDIQPASNYAAQAIAFYNAVKSVNASIQVAGPSPVSFLASDRAWMQGFFDAGGGSAVDLIAVHFYNMMIGDFVMGRQNIAALKTLLAANGQGGKRVLQTEQGDQFGLYGLQISYFAVKHTLARMLLWEQAGFQSEDNFYWQEIDHGDSNWKTGLLPGGGFSPSALGMRRWGCELWGKTRASNYSFSGFADDVYIGSLFGGSAGSVAVFMTNGDTQGSLSLSVTGATSVTVAQWDGKTATQAVTGGKITLAVGLLPVYVRLPVGVTLSVDDPAWGDNLLAGATVTTSAGDGDAGLLTNGVFESEFDYPLQWTSAGNPAQGPVDIFFALAAPQTINKLDIHALPIWQSEGALLDYEWSAWNGSSWTTLTSRTESVKCIPGYSNSLASTFRDYSPRRNVFQDRFSAVTTDRLRLRVNAATAGGNVMAPNGVAGGQGHNAGQTVTMREVAAYHMAAAVTIAAAPKITSPATVIFIRGTPSTFQPTASGNPTSWDFDGLPASCTGNIKTGEISYDGT